mgnify:FL=1
MLHIAQEFRAFAMRGNVVDLAVGVVIGAAFGKIVTSLVDDIIMPLLALVLGGVDFSNLAWTIKDETVTASGRVIGEAVKGEYGAFIQTTLDFIIVAFAIFLAIKVMNRLHLRKDKKEEPATLTKQEQLLTEIRDGLFKR